MYGVGRWEDGANDCMKWGAEMGEDGAGEMGGSAAGVNDELTVDDEVEVGFGFVFF
jgi:hypothetical protein